MIRRFSISILSLLRKYFIPAHIVELVRHKFDIDTKLKSNSEHLDKAMQWMVIAFRAGKNGGVSAGYSIKRGWLKPYPETTGYIISTFLDYYNLTNKVEYREMAIKMGDWEIDIQMKSGAVRGGQGINDFPIVFNTGQVIFGWIDLYKNTNDNKYLDAAKSAGDWLIEIQESDGSWIKNTYREQPHAYHSRVAWSLLYIWSVSGEEKYYKAGLKNVQWCMSNVQDNLWINYMEFSKGKNAYLHTIAYTIRGLMESALILKTDYSKEILSYVEEVSELLLLKYERRKKSPLSNPLPMFGDFNEKWVGNKSYSCLTGNSQLAIVWLKLTKITEDARYLNAALKINDYNKSKQNVFCFNKDIKGGIAGSFPHWGGYLAYTYPNWAAKFFADSIMLQEKVMKELEK